MNKMNTNKLIIYVVSILILFSIPIYTVLSNTDTLKDGTEYLFKVEAFDPYDMFRGNYLDIRFVEDTIYGINLEHESYTKDEYYVTIGIHNNGFAYFTDINKEKPEYTSNYFKTSAYYNPYYNEYTIDTPTRYYMNENKSLMAEQVYNDNIDNTYVKVRVKDGEMVIVGIYVNNTLIDTID